MFHDLIRRGRRGRRGPGRWVTVAAALALTAATVTIASPAYAEQFPIADSFEGNPYDRWTVSTVPGLTTVSMGAHQTRGRTGPNLALLNAYPDSPANATVFRTITPDSTTPRQLACRVLLYIARVANAGENPDDNVNVFIKIRQGGPTGPVIANNGMTIKETRDWEGHESNPIPWPTSTITLEIAAYHGTAFVDDVAFRCSQA